MKQEIYDGLSRLLTEYEEGVHETRDWEKEMYAMLCKIQNAWEDITAQY